MRWLWAVVMAGALAGSMAFADSGGSGSEPGAGGGGTVIVDPGYCWGGGVVPQPPPIVDPGYCWGGGVVPQPLPGGGEDGGVIVSPPDGDVSPPEGVYSPGEAMPGGGDISPTYGANVELGLLASGGAVAAHATGAQQAVASRGERRSQMYVPPAVWKWVAEHPLRKR